jgi:hypothetical protein
MRALTDAAGGQSVARQQQEESGAAAPAATRSAVAEMVCGCDLHFNCVAQWLGQYPTCPVCNHNQRLNPCEEWTAARYVERWRASSGDREAPPTISIGGFGTVYQFTLEDGVTHVAVKKLSDSVSLAEFDAELRQLVALRHPNIIRALAVCRDRKAYVFPLLEPLSAALLGQAPYDNAAIRIALCADLAAAVEYVHSVGRAVRDIKIANALVRTVAHQQQQQQRSGAAVARPQLVLCDLGAARSGRQHDARRLHGRVRCAGAAGWGAATRAAARVPRR